MKADLHIHSSFSFDSDESVASIIALAKAINLDYIAIADHNQYRGALILEKSSHIKSISAIEIDCMFNDVIIHLLGYGIDLNDPYYETLYRHYKDELSRIAIQRLELIETKLNIVIDRKKLAALSSPPYSYTNVEITQVLLSDYRDHPFLYPYVYGEKKDNPLANFFWDNLALNKWGYVPMNLPDYVDVINTFHRTKGICIVAHPVIGVNRNKVAIQQLLDAKIDGFEAYSSYHTKEDIQFYLDICQNHQLLYTCGSDYHGKNKPNIHLGETKHEEDDAQWLLPLLEKINYQD